MEERRETEGVFLVECEECGRAWRDPTERWRAYITDDDFPVAVAYCPVCAEREFGQ